MAKKAAATKAGGSHWTPEKLQEAGRRRSQTATIRKYLGMIAERPRNGYRADPERLQKKLEGVCAAMVDADPISRVKLVQQRMDLEQQLADIEGESEYEEAEAAFIEHAWDWAQREGIGYAALREVGVTAAILDQAGISRT